MAKVNKKNELPRSKANEVSLRASSSVSDSSPLQADGVFSLKNKKKEEIKMDNVQKTQSVIRGRVTSAKKPQTVTVLVESVKKHPLYGKTYKRSKKYLVHDLLGVSEGDIVEILQVRPISKNKHFQVLRVVGKDIEAIVSEQLKEDAKEAIAEVMPEEEKVSQGEEVSQVPQGEEKEVEKKTRGTRGTRRTSDTSKEAK